MAAAERVHLVYDFRKLIVNRAMPPIVQIAARLAPGGAAFVDDDVLAEATFFVAPVDEGELRRAIDQTPGVDERHLAAMVQAKLAIAEEARSSASSPPPGRAMRSTASMADRDTSRWIGRSSGL